MWASLASFTSGFAAMLNCWLSSKSRLCNSFYRHSIRLPQFLVVVAIVCSLAVKGSGYIMAALRYSGCLLSDNNMRNSFNAQSTFSKCPYIPLKYRDIWGVGVGGGISDERKSSF